MSTHNALIKHYALLIGIDAYPERPLRSCVADVGKMKTYLRDVLPNAYIQTLTAAQKTSTGGRSETGGADSRPTLANVISTLDRITNQAQQGDFFYLHYSGHGSREPPTVTSSNEATGDVVLVLFSTCEEDQEIYLYGSDLADCLKGMVDKGIFVTLVLDCCHAGSVYRQGSNVRFLPYSPEVASRSPRIIAKAPVAPSSCQTSRGASMLPNWLVNPDGYAILTACGPLEAAQEFKLDSSGTEREQRYGALSYFLCLALLECGGVGTKHQQVHSLIIAKFRINCPKQNPVLYGNKHQGFFDKYIPRHLSASTAVMSMPGTLNLPLGLAHGCNFGFDNHSSMCHICRAPKFKVALSER
ncbi:hypothetical protein S7711_10028 [Stachybotrys chartarum IBT 7711]|uniref:Peptidase C14 caspase domain-containing protein n=1 Tax=Stachybotrys chartarum (strain CBS 109288 / IBT 7711) TaxID=1280523 RepID=A0A084AEX6_STACB|nr:hypothetical protein S7711_10028 [Stachybotrys chartarum IBT 7711]